MVLKKCSAWGVGLHSPEKNQSLLVTFKELEMRNTIMSNLKNLRNQLEKFRGVAISPDLHPKER